MIRKLKFLCLALFLLFSIHFSLIICPARAAGEFSTDLDVTYKVNESGVTEVINKVTLTNIFSNLYATSYSIVLDSINPANARAYNTEGVAYSLNKSTDNDKTTLRVEFPDTIVGKDKSRTFYIVFEESSFAVRTGEVWEISIPRLSEDATFNSYNLNLQVPEKLGLEAYISPTPREKTNVNGYLTYNFSKADVEKTGITAGFGAFQVFSFTLNYHLENPLAKSAKTEITIPPDTAYQKVYYSNITPKPSSMSVDSDGNWIAEYVLSPRERVDVVATGHVQIFSNYRPFKVPLDDNLNQNLLQSDYWDTTNPEIKRLANELKTPRAIYDYVSQTLKYDYARVRPNVERLGSVRALDNPTSAICMEFTDLFIALARAAGIPAREINGYAYTENPDIQPLSLVNDVLHAWPEYYDKEKAVWVPVDPTWGSTTGGVDYFSKLDLRHFTFVIHGMDATKPYPAGSYKLGSNPQKDVFVSFGSLPEARNSNLEVSANIEGWIPLISNRLNIKITNPGPAAVYKITPNIYFDGVKKEANINIFELLPFQETKSIVEIPFSFLGINTPNIVKVEVLGKEVIIPTNKKHVIIYNLLFIFVVTILILVTIMFRLKKWKFPKRSS